LNDFALDEVQGQEEWSASEAESSFTGSDERALYGQAVFGLDGRGSVSESGDVLAVSGGCVRG